MAISDGFYDPFDGPGYYQQGSAMTANMPIDNSRVHVRYFFDKNHKKNNGIRYILVKGEKLFIRKRWWGGIQITANRQLATVFDDVDKTEEWAKKRGLIQQ